ncbi:hypothetical protein Tco_1358387 [Tanacetum coccineum]
MNNVYSMLIQEEQVKTMTRDKDYRLEIMALAMQNQTKIKNESLSYTHCHKVGHTKETCFEINRYPEWWEETCFEINGFPEWWGERPRVDRKAGSYEKGTTTGRGKGRRSRGSTRTNIVQAGGDTGANTGTSDSNVILLLGASHHMTCMIEEIFNLKEIVQCLVELPDGNIDLTSRMVIGAGERRDGGLFYF